MYTSLNGDPRSKLSDLIHGTAHNPFTQRMLVPVLSRTIHTMSPANVWEDISSWLAQQPKFQKESKRLGWEIAFLPHYLIALFLALLSLIGFTYTMRVLFASMYETGPLVEKIVPLVALFGLPPFFNVGTHYIYDFTALFLFLLGAVLLFKQRWKYFYPVFIVGLLNKETMIMLSFLLLLVFHNNIARKSLVRHFVTQFAIFIAIKGLLVYTFASNPGTNLEFHLFGNIHDILMPYSMSSFAIAMALLFLVFHDWKSKPILLRQSLWLVAPFGALMICFAWLTEIRDAYEVYPFIFLLIVHTICFSIGRIPYHLKHF